MCVNIIICLLPGQNILEGIDCTNPTSDDTMCASDETIFPASDDTVAVSASFDTVVSADTIDAVHYSDNIVIPSHDDTVAVPSIHNAVLSSYDSTAVLASDDSVAVSDSDDPFTVSGRNAPVVVPACDDTVLLGSDITVPSSFVTVDPSSDSTNVFPAKAYAVVEPTNVNIPVHDDTVAVPSIDNAVLAKYVSVSAHASDDYVAVSNSDKPFYCF